jgi:type I restriction-modification system DNA methylase subunit
MQSYNYEIALYNTPFFENLVSELYRICRYKSNILKKIRTSEEYLKKLSFEERLILKDLSKKENQILLEIMAHKRWLDLPRDTVEYFIRALGEKYESHTYSDAEDYRNDLIH